jgi:hypothetical protein
MEAALAKANASISLNWPTVWGRRRVNSNGRSTRPVRIATGSFVRLIRNVRPTPRLPSLDRFRERPQFLVFVSAFKTASELGNTLQRALTVELGFDRDLQQDRLLWRPEANYLACTSVANDSSVLGEKVSIRVDHRDFPKRDRTRRCNE